MDALVRAINQRWNLWLARRLPAKSHIALNQRRIFIFPTKQGGYFLLLIALLFVLAINYQNSLVFALCFFLLGVFFVCIYHTFFNMYGLEVQSLGAAPTFQYTDAEYELKLIRQGANKHYSLEINWAKQITSHQGVLVSHGLRGSMSKTIVVPCATQRRGWYHPGRLKIKTVFPLGLFQSWTWLDFGQTILVYPQAVSIDGDVLHYQQVDTSNAAFKLDVDGELHGFREYQIGDPMKRIEWKSLAKGLPLMTRQYQQYQQQGYWLDWDALAGVAFEMRLSQLCYLAIQWHQQGWRFGLKLPDNTIAIDSGERHLQRVLTALALHGGDG